MTHCHILHFSLNEVITFFIEQVLYKMCSSRDIDIRQQPYRL